MERTHYSRDSLINTCLLAKAKDKDIILSSCAEFSSISSRLVEVVGWWVE